MLIYKITNRITNKVYVGVTRRTLALRWRGHLKQAAQGKLYPLYRAMRRDGLQNFSIEQLDVADTEKAMFEKEMAWISKLKSNQKPHGYNLTHGGVGILVVDYAKRPRPPCSEETRRKIGEANTGVRNGNYGTHPKRSEATKRKMSIAMKTSAKLQASRKSKAFRQKLSDIQSRSVVIIENNQIVATVKNLKEAAKKLNCTHGNVKNARRDQRPVAGRFYIMYKDDHNMTLE
jgi:group I intron endonuclease